MQNNFTRFHWNHNHLFYMSIYLCENQNISPNIKNETQMQHILEMCMLGISLNCPICPPPPPHIMFLPLTILQKNVQARQKIEVRCFATQAFVIEQFLFMFTEVCNNAIHGL
jgi:hypothetical protein